MLCLAVQSPITLIIMIYAISNSPIFIQSAIVGNGPFPFIIFIFFLIFDF